MNKPYGSVPQLIPCALTVGQMNSEEADAALAMALHQEELQAASLARAGQLFRQLQDSMDKVTKARLHSSITPPACFLTPHLSLQSFLFQLAV